MLPASLAGDMQSDQAAEQGANIRKYEFEEELSNISEPLNIPPEFRPWKIAPSHETKQNGQPHDHEAKTAYYNSASEKSLSHAEAKLFFHRHQLENSQHEDDTQSPLARARTFSSTVDGEGGLSRTASTTSLRSGKSHVPRERRRRPTHDVGLRSPFVSATDPHENEDEIPFAAGQVKGIEDSELGTEHEDDFDGVALRGSDISPELNVISLNIKRVLDIRHKYISLSLQGSNDNPRDGLDWKIYPPPPNPTWDENKNRPISQVSGPDSLSSSRVLSTDQDQSLNAPMSPGPWTGDWAHQVSTSPASKRRKPGQDIGEDFDMKDLEPLPTSDENIVFNLDSSSVYQISEIAPAAVKGFPLVKVPALREYYKDMDDVQNVSSDGPTKSFAYRQLDILEGRFHLYSLVNSYQETADCKRVPHRDFYNVRKVDTHVHHSACMNQKHLLRFIKSKMKKSPDEVVMFRNGKHMTLKEVFESINLTAYDLSIDTLDMHVRQPFLAIM